jgi:hypothetical protein
LPSVADQTIAARSFLSVTNTATDPDLPANNLFYRLLARPPGALPDQLVNPPAGAKIDTNGLVTWTPTLAEAPSTNIFTVIVTDDGFPPLSTTNSFMVTVLAPPAAPAISSLILSNNVATLTWSATAGCTYRLQCTTDPASTNWDNLGPDVFANGASASCSHPLDGSVFKFYRVLLVH